MGPPVDATICISFDVEGLIIDREEVFAPTVIFPGLLALKEGGSSCIHSCLVGSIPQVRYSIPQSVQELYLYQRSSLEELFCSLLT